MIDNTNQIFPSHIGFDWMTLASSQVIALVCSADLMLAVIKNYYPLPAILNRATLTWLTVHWIGLELWHPSALCSLPGCWPDMSRVRLHVIGSVPHSWQRDLAPSLLLYLLPCTFMLRWSWIASAQWSLDAPKYNPSVLQHCNFLCAVPFSNVCLASY